MSRVPLLSSPLLLGFDELEHLVDRATKSAGDGYPPYNIERIAGANGKAQLRITLAVAGFDAGELEVTVEENQLVVRGRQKEEPERVYLHRGIAARQFQRAFVLADGLQVEAAHLDNGLLLIDLVRPEPEKLVRRIEINVGR